MPGQEPLTSQPAGPFNAVNVVKCVVLLVEPELRSTPRIRRPEPFKCLANRLVFGVDATFRVAPVRPQLPPIGIQLLGGDGQAAQARHAHRQCHAAVLADSFISVDPAAVGFLRSLVEAVDRLPNGRRESWLPPAGRRKGRVMRIANWKSRTHGDPANSPTRGALTRPSTGRNEPVNIPLNGGEVPRIAHFGKNHRLQADDVGKLRLDLAQLSKPR